MKHAFRRRPRSGQRRSLPRLLALSIALGYCAVSSAALEDNDLLGMSMEDLINVRIASSASLSPISQATLPNRVTRIERSLIALSGARSLNELLEMHVPGLQWINHSFGVSHLGMRGIVSTRDDKFLLLVNGQSVNHVSHAGAFTERDLPMLGDIEAVEVVHGPGSAVNGLGAVAMTINIITRRPDEAGCSSALRAGAIERFVTAETGCTSDLGDWGRLRYYIGASRYPGAANADAPLMFSSALTTRWGDTVPANGNTSALPFTADHAEYRGQPAIKLHLQWEQDDNSAQFRYTRGGEMVAPSVLTVAMRPVGNSTGPTPFPYAAYEFGYQQWTGRLERRMALDGATLTVGLEGVRTDYEELAPANNNTLLSNLEDRWTLRSLWQRHQGSHTLSLGASYEVRQMGKASPGYPDQPPSSELFPVMPRWDTNVLSLYAEDQWQLPDQWQLLAGLRGENHTYVGTTWSPRLSLGHPVGDNGHLSLTLERAQRANFEDELYASSLGTVSSDKQVETIDNLELLYRLQSESFGSFEANLYASTLETIGISGTLAGGGSVSSRPVGTQRNHGLDLSWRGRALGAQWSASHSWVVLDSFTLGPGIAETQVTAAPNGYGNSLNGYASHQTKLSVQGNWSAHTAWWLGYIYYHDFAGTQDRQRMLDDRRVASGLAPTVAPGRNESAGPNHYLHAGLSWRLDPSTTVDLHGFNLLGLLDRDYNKRNYLNNVSQYRLLAPSLAVSLRWELK